MMQQPDQISVSCLEHNQAALNSLRRAVNLGQGEFSLILVQANYRHLRQMLLRQLSQEFDLNIVSLPPNATSLRKLIAQQMATDTTEQARWQTATKDKALIVIGIEEIEASNLVKLLKTANLGRDELPKSFPYPVVLWVDDTVLGQMNRYAPDLKSFAATPIRFDYPLSALTTILSAQADDTFSQILDGQTVSLWPGHLPHYSSLNAGVSELIAVRELRFAIARITQIPEAQERLLSLELLVDLLFFQARSLHRRGESEKARYRYEKSLSYWQQKGTDDSTDDQETKKPNSQAIDRIAVLLFHLGLWWRSQAVPTAPNYDATSSESIHRKFFREASYRLARHYFEAVIDIFKKQRRSDRLGQFISSLAEILKQLKDWDALSAITHEAIPLHQNDPIRLALDYGYLAEALLAKNNNHPTPTDIVAAQNSALRALEISQSISLSSVSISPYSVSLSSTAPSFTAPSFTARYRTFLRYQRGGYFYLLARVHQLSGQTATAIDNLERALQNTSPYYDLALYRQILDRLWMLYFKHKRYAEAFEVKLEQRRVESLFGLRAFIGAGQIQPTPTMAATPLNAQTDVALSAAIKASGRAEDIASLINRLAQPRYPIVVIHGQSGVGKSSILRAGLIPQLRLLMREGRTTLPILIGGYGNWANQIENALAEENWADDELTAAESAETTAITSTLTAHTLSNKLQKFVQDRYQQVVLILDQFEDFFYKYPNVSERKQLYTFLRDCLDLSYVKVVISIREDFLHYLLEWDRSADLETINNDILSKEIRYYLGNFTPQAAERLIQRLSEPSAFSPEPALETALVDDLSALTGEVRPIELQDVGAQLQRQKIETQAAYRALGRSPQKQLLKNFLDNVIYDCGPENQTVANSVLYL
ncbi:MAG: ATP-binding protein, partial [Cyanobacteria bacterium P01_D01_bin.1]